MKIRNITFTTMLLLLSCVALSLTARADTPLPLHAQLIPPPDPDRVAGTLEMLLTHQYPPDPCFQAAGQVHLTPPPDPDMPYTFGEIVQHDGTVVISIGNPDVRGNETFFDINGCVSADVASQMRQVPTSFTVRFYNGAGLAAQGTLQFGHLFTDTPR